jgi:hypothetical protein
MPLEWVATRCAAKNQVRKGKWVRCMIVPAVTDVWRAQAPHSDVHAFVSSFLPRFDAQDGQTKPSGQRRLASQAAQALSLRKSAMKRWSDGGRSCFQRETR